MTENNELATYYNEDNTFSISEANTVIEKYVCPMCYGPLVVVWIPNYERVLIVCTEHGNVCNIGRITHATVGIQTDKAYRDYHRVIRNLPDLWGDLIVQGFERVQAIKITKYYVCAIGGCRLTSCSRQDDPTMETVDICCSVNHGNINDTGYVRKEDFVYDFQRMKAWEKKLREEKTASV